MDRRTFCAGLLGAGLMLTVSPVALAAGTEVFAWTGGGDNSFVRSGKVTPDTAKRGFDLVVAAAKKQLRTEDQPSAEAIVRFHEAVDRLTFDANHPDNGVMVGTVVDDEEHLLMLGGHGKTYRYVITRPSEWKKGRSHRYFRIVYIHQDGTVEEWRVYQVCGNVTYSRFRADGSPCIPLPAEDKAAATPLAS